MWASACICCVADVTCNLGGLDIATVAPVTFTSADSQNSIVSSQISMPDISETINCEENRLLQSEVESLTHDMHAISARLQTTQEGYCFLSEWFLATALTWEVMWSHPSVCPSVCLHSVFGTEWLLTLNLCVSVVRDHSSQGIEGHGHRSRSWS